MMNYPLLIQTFWKIFGKCESGLFGDSLTTMVGHNPVLQTTNLLFMLQWDVSHGMGWVRLLNLKFTPGGVFEN